MKRRSQSEPLASMQNIWKEEAGPSDVTDESQGSTFKKYKSSIYQNQRKGMPLNPKNLQEAVTYFETPFINGILSKPTEGRSIYYEVSSNESSFIAVFGSSEILQNLPEEGLFSITASMNVVPTTSIFKSLVTICAIKNDDVSTLAIKVFE